MHINEGGEFGRRIRRKITANGLQLTIDCRNRICQTRDFGFDFIF